MLLHLRSQLVWARSQADKACLILGPVHGAGPQHWTALILFREAGSVFMPKYYDSLAVDQPECRAQAAERLAMLSHILGAEAVAQTELPATERPVVQKDGYSCGYHTLSRMEEAYRQLIYRFHGIKPGKKKQERRLRQLQEDQKVMSMAGQDTPLGTASALRNSQAASGKSHMVISKGNTATASLPSQTRQGHGLKFDFTRG